MVQTTTRLDIDYCVLDIVMLPAGTVQISLSESVNIIIFGAAIAICDWLSNNKK
jgi:hypothetical protein